MSKKTAIASLTATCGTIRASASRKAPGRWAASSITPRATAPSRQMSRTRLAADIGPLPDQASAAPV